MFADPLVGNKPGMNSGPTQTPVRAVLFDRDGTLVEDVAYNGDPARVRTMPGAHQALDELRLHGIRTWRWVP